MPTIVRWPAEVLATPAKPVDAFDAELAQLLEDLVATMRPADGVGLAAPQVGVPLRVAVALDRRRPRERVVEMVNPAYVPLDGAAWREPLREGCLSVPGEFHRVMRHQRLLLRYQDRDGRWRQEEATGAFAHVVQHEVDHLEGRVFVDYLAAMRRAEIRRRMGAGGER